MAKKIISTVISVILIGVVLFTGIKLELKMNEYRLEKQKKIEVSMQAREGREVDFDALLKKNKDVKGWIYLPKSEIDYPVVQAEDNDYYLHRGLDGQYAYEGTIFIDGGCENPFRCFNTVIYGHHMFSGAMFCGLDEFKDEKYFRENNIIQIETPDQSYDLHVIAYCNEPEDSDLYTMYFDEEEDDVITEVKPFTKSDFIELIKQKAIILSKEDFGEDDCFVTLSTCAYNYDDARTQVIGILKEPGLEERATVEDSDNPVLNKWLFAQIGVAVLMILMVCLPFMGRKKGNKS